MYAIIKTGGKQYRVAKGDIIDVELLGHNSGDQVEFGEVLFAYDGSATHIGKPGIRKFSRLRRSVRPGKRRKSY